jgi:hypothetical protein
VIRIDPLPSNAGANVRLVLMVAGDNFDRSPKHFPTKVLERHLRGEDAASAGYISI